MPVHNADIARVFEEIADLLELADENPFRIRAYRNAARTVGELRLDIAASIASGRPLPKIPGVGADLDGKIHEIAATGACSLLSRLRKRFPSGVTELLKLPGIGPKRARTLLGHGIGTPALLKQAAAEGRLHGIEGFGEKTEQRMEEAVTEHLSKERRYKLAVAEQYAEPLAKAVGAQIAGSYRRRRDTVGDLDLLAASDTPIDVIERLITYPEVGKVLVKGTTKASVLLASGIQVDLRVVPRQSAGAALHYLTGSRAHNIAVRKLGVALGLKINEYGVFRGNRRIAGETEQSVYSAVGLPYIEPELREDRGELEAARSGELPELVELDDIQGDLHSHTKATDGHDSLRDMALAAKSRGLRYLAITDHSRRETMAHGLDPVRLARQLAEIDALNQTLSGITLLKGIEVDILERGDLDLPDAILSRLDVVVAAVHGHLGLPRARQTERILRAMENPHVSILAHPSGRLIGERAPCEVDMLAIIRKARDTGVFMELNAQPERLDLDDVHCRMAKDEGVLVAINSDAHAAQHFELLRFGIAQARRGWLGRGDVLNCRPLPEVRQLLEQRRSGERAPRAA